MLKLILLIIFALIAIIAAMANMFFKVGKNPKPTDIEFRKLIRFRMICYIIMMILLLLLIIL